MEEVVQQLRLLTEQNQALTTRLEASEAELLRQRGAQDQAQQVVVALSQLPQTLQEMIAVKSESKKILVDSKGLGKPHPFNNVEADFLKWSRKTSNYMNSVLKGLAPVLASAVDEEDAIVWKKFQESNV